MAKRQFARNRISPKRLLALLVALTVAFFLLTSVINLAQKYFAIRRNIRDLRESHDTLVQKQSALATKNAYIATPEGQEEELRNRFNLVRPGEGVIVLTEPSTAANPPAPREGVVARWWEGILRGLGIKK